MSGARVTVRLVRDDELEAAGDVVAAADRQQPGMDEDEPVEGVLLWAYALPL